MTECDNNHFSLVVPREGQTRSCWQDVTRRVKDRAVTLKLTVFLFFNCSSRQSQLTQLQASTHFSTILEAIDYALDYL